MDFLRGGELAKFESVAQKKKPLSFFFCGADETRTREKVDNQLVSNFKYHSTLGRLVPISGSFFFFSKASAKVLLFFELCKFFGKKMLNLYDFS